MPRPPKWLRSLVQERKKNHKSQNEKKSFKCKLCNITIKNDRWKLKRHMKTVHENRKDYQCEQCGKSYAQKDTLKKHENGVHFKMKPYECEICGKAYILSRSE